MAEDVKITILSENTAGREGLTGEYGQSVWIEADGTSILFDTGMAGAFAKNAEVLEVDLSKAVHLCLSHGHIDHTGGVLLALEKAPQALVHLHPDAARPKYLVGSAGETVPVGMPEPGLRAIRHRTSRCLFLTDVTRITSNVRLTGPVPRKTSFESRGEHFSLDPEGTIPDTMPDDQALWIETGKGLVILLGCSHSGVVNTVEYIREKSGREDIRAIIGGMHLMNADKETILHTMDALAAMRPGLVSPNHCTGEAACTLMRERFRDSYRPGPAGSVFTFTA